MKNGRYFWGGCASCTIVAIIVCGISVSVYHKSQERIYFRPSSSLSSSHSTSGDNYNGQDPAVASSNEVITHHYEQRFGSSASLVPSAMVKGDDWPNQQHHPSSDGSNKKPTLLPPLPNAESSSSPASASAGSSLPTIDSARRWERRHSAVPPAFSPPETMYFGRKAAPVYRITSGESTDGNNKNNIRATGAAGSSNSRWPLPPDSRETIDSSSSSTPSIASMVESGRQQERLFQGLNSRHARHLPADSTSFPAGQLSTMAGENLEKSGQKNIGAGVESSIFGIPGMTVRSEYSAKSGRKFFSVGGSDSSPPPAHILEKISRQIEEIRKARESSPAGMGLITHANLMTPQNPAEELHKLLSIKEAEIRSKRNAQVLESPPAAVIPARKPEQPAEMTDAVKKLLQSLPPGLSKPDIHSFVANYDVDRLFPQNQQESPANGNNEGTIQNADAGVIREEVTPSMAPSSAAVTVDSGNDAVEFETQNQRPPTVASHKSDNSNVEATETKEEKSGALMAPLNGRQQMAASIMRRMGSSSDSAGRSMHSFFNGNNKPPLSRRPDPYESMRSSMMSSSADRGATDGLIGSPVMNAEDVVKLLSRGKALTPYSVDGGTVLRQGKVLARSTYDPDSNMYLPMKRRQVDKAMIREAMAGGDLQQGTGYDNGLLMNQGVAEP